MSEKSLLSPREKLAQNLKDLRYQIQEAQNRSPYGAEEVTLVAVTKRHGPEAIRLLGELGQVDLGESYVQKGLAKEDEVDGEFQWHLIGHLQRNKIKKAVPFYSVIHSLDSIRLLRALNDYGESNDEQIEALVQVNVSGEDSKYGFAPEELDEFFSIWKGECPRVQITGLMTMAPYIAPEETRPFFRKLREVRDHWQEKYPQVVELSMGMSNDFIVAVEEGATMVRLGTILFEGVET